MKSNKQYQVSVSQTYETDVLVVGGGVGGCAAAIAAARGGTRTMLLEASGVLGGQAGFGLVTPLDARKTVSGKSFGGLVEEISDEVAQLGDAYCSNAGHSHNFTLASPHILKYVLLKKAIDSGVDVRFHTTLVDVVTEGDKVRSVIALNKSGFCEIGATTFIDGTGDADLICGANASSVAGSEPGVFRSLVETDLAHRHFSDESYAGYDHDGLMQPVSLFFIMGNVDVSKAMSFNNKLLKFGDLGITKEKFLAWKFANTPGFEVTDDRIPMPQGRILVSRGPRGDMAVMNMSRITGIDASQADGLNRGEIQAQLQLIAIVDFLQTFVPGFENSYYIQSASSLGVRETRRLVGRYILSGYEAIMATQSPDVVARGSYIIDIHDPNGKAMAIGGKIKGDFYDIPFGCLLAKEYDNLMACGRCISVDHIAHSSTRIQGTCIMTGQAAGTAAALALHKGMAVADLPVKELQERLRSDKVYID